MTKQFKQFNVSFKQKLESCTDELSYLLDLIYKFPQQQRQQYYDRIQLLKQNLTHLKSYVKDNPTGATLNSLQKKYQQVYIKINDLKSQINTCQASIPHKKKKSILGDVSPHFIQPSSYNITTKLNKAPNKTQYDIIMEIIVQKEEQAKKYKSQAEQYQRTIKQYVQKQQSTALLMQSLQKQLYQIREINQNNFSKIEIFQIQLIGKNQELKTFQNLYKEEKISNQFMRQQLYNLKALLQQVQNNFKIKRVETQSYATQLAVYQEKYRFDSKLYTEREQMAKLKQKNYQKKVNDLEKQLQILREAEKSSKSLQLQNLRLKQDLKVIQAQLTLKQEHLYQKNRKIETNKAQISLLKVKNQEIQQEIIQKQAIIDKLRKAQKDNQNIIVLLQRKLKEIQQFAAELQEKNLILNKKSQQIEINLKQSETQVKNKDQQIKKLLKTQKKIQQNYSNSDEQRKKAQKQLDRLSLQLAKAEKKINELNTIIEMIVEEKNEQRLKNEQNSRLIMEKQQNIRNYLKQIQSLKKRLFRAKIESIHNIRQVLL